MASSVTEWGIENRVLREEVVSWGVTPSNTFIHASLVAPVKTSGLQFNLTPYSLVSSILFGPGSVNALDFHDIGASQHIFLWSV